MSQVAITKVNDSDKRKLPIFEEVAKRCLAIERRAFELFENRGRELGHELEDWLEAEHELMGWPAAELVEKEGAYELQMTLPGFEAKDVEVTATPTEVIVHAATEEEKKTEKGKVLWTEYGSNNVYRRVQLQNPINVEKVTAELDKGILRINAPAVAKSRETKVAAA